MLVVAGFIWRGGEKGNLTYHGDLVPVIELDGRNLWCGHVGLDFGVSRDDVRRMVARIPRW